MMESIEFMGAKLEKRMRSMSRLHSQPVGHLGARRVVEGKEMWRGNPKGRGIEDVEEKKGKDKGKGKKQNMSKQDLQKIRVELCKRIQQEKGRSRMENILFFERIQKKEMKNKFSKADSQNLPPSTTKDNFKENNQLKSDKNIDRSLKGLFETIEMRKSDSSSLASRDNSQQLKNGRRFKSIQVRTMSKLIMKKKDFTLQATQPAILWRNPASFEKLGKYRQFLNKICYANKILVETPPEPQKKLVYFLGKGNNSMLIKSLLKRRFWWTEGTIDQANFVWTQLKKPQILEKQPEFIEEEPHEYTSQCLSNSDIMNRSLLQSPKINNKSRTSFSCPAGQDKILCSTELTDYCKNKKAINLRKAQPKLVHNHFSGNCHLGNKKALFFNLSHYCSLVNKQLFDMVPLTFHIGQDYRSFQKQFKRRSQLIKQGHPKLSNLWIVKPGENSNRGNGIHLINSLAQLDLLLSSRKCHSNGQKLTYIVQLYMNRVFLYNRRKFDIRHYMLVTKVGTCVRAYWYKEGYIRTSSKVFDLEDKNNQEVHLTNDAIQKYSEDYGRYEEGNKLSYSEFQRYLDMQHKERRYSFGEVLGRMREVAAEAVRATYLKLEPTNKEFNFQIFGLDFMLDENLKPWLIEVNTNPCLEISSNLLGRIIPNMVEHAFRICLDTLFPPPNDYPVNQRHFLPNRAQQHLKFQIMFNSDFENLTDLYKNDQQQQPELCNISQEQEQFQDQGNEINFVQ